MITLALIGACALSVAAQPISIVDLKALAAAHAWHELLDKAEDVAPTERTSEWKTAVRDAAIASLQPDTAVHAPFDEAKRADVLATRFRFLTTDPAFDSARGEVVALGIDACLHEADDAPCWQLEAAYEKTLTGLAAAHAAQAFVKAGAVKYRPMALFAAAITSKDRNLCTDSALADAVIASLDLPVTHEAAKNAVKVGTGWCWPALASKLKASMVGASNTRLSNLCKPLRSKKALSDLQAEVCADAGE